MNKNLLILTIIVVVYLQVISCKNNKNTILNSAQMPADKDFNKDKVYHANNQVSYKIKEKYWRNQLYFTQGLSFLDENTLLESSGLHGQSVIQKINLDDDVKITKQVELSKEYFGEGSDIIEIKNEKHLIMLTWKQRQIFVYNDKMEKIGSHQLPKEIKEGWGLTHYTNSEGKLILLISDGSNNIYHVDPISFKTIKTVPVFYGNKQPANRINELEFYKGNVLANVWGFNYILEIDIETGKILQQLDFSDITSNLNNSKDFKNYTYNTRDFCLNGIAYNEKSDRFILTGKKWPWFYEIEFQ